MRAPQSYNYSNSSEFPTNSEFKFRGQFPRETESVERAPAVSMESCSPANTASAHLYMKRKLQTKRVERAQRAQIVEPIVKNHAPPPPPISCQCFNKKKLRTSGAEVFAGGVEGTAPRPRTLQAIVRYGARDNLNGMRIGSKPHSTFTLLPGSLSFCIYRTASTCRFLQDCELGSRCASNFSKG
jgi:hypothetical protein